MPNTEIKKSASGAEKKIQPKPEISKSALKAKEIEAYFRKNVSEKGVLKWSIDAIWCLSHYHDNAIDNYAVISCLTHYQKCCFFQLLNNSRTTTIMWLWYFFEENTQYLKNALTDIGISMYRCKIDHPSKWHERFYELVNTNNHMLRIIDMIEEYERMMEKEKGTK